jgi:predicted ATPase
MRSRAIAMHRPYSSRLPWKELFENDAQRRHTFADAVAEYEALLAAYPANGYAIELIPKAGVEARADFLEERLERLQSEGRDRDR